MGYSKNDTSYPPKGTGVTIFNGSNYFSEERAKIVCLLLEKGETVDIYISCIGFTRATVEGNEYREFLIKKYGDDLIVTAKENEYFTSWFYKLKNL